MGRLWRWLTFSIPEDRAACISNFDTDDAICTPTFSILFCTKTNHSICVRITFDDLSSAPEDPSLYFVSSIEYLLNYFYSFLLYTQIVTLLICILLKFALLSNWWRSIDYRITVQQTFSGTFFLRLYSIELKHQLEKIIIVISEKLLSTRSRNDIMKTSLV